VKSNLNVKSESSESPACRSRWGRIEARLLPSSRLALAAGWEPASASANSVKAGTGSLRPPVTHRYWHWQAQDTAAVTVTRSFTSNVFGVVRRSTFAARADPAIVIPLAQLERWRSGFECTGTGSRRRHQERVEARGGKCVRMFAPSFLGACIHWQRFAQLEQVE
jgi:hypothetical protein